jgi:hypothetical protein
MKPISAFNIYGVACTACIRFPARAVRAVSGYTTSSAALVPTILKWIRGVRGLKLTADIQLLLLHQVTGFDR